MRDLVVRGRKVGTFRISHGDLGPVRECDGTRHRADLFRLSVGITRDPTQAVVVVLAQRRREGEAFTVRALDVVEDVVIPEQN
jgi:hypothetical protein